MISCDPAASSPAPVHEGQSRGYFTDEATRLLLGLGTEVVPLNSGTYGEEEPGVKAVKLSLLRLKSYDQLLLPFVPKNHWFHNTPLSISVQNRQYAAHPQSLRQLEELLSKALLDAQIGANNSGLNMPEYARQLVPKLRFKAGKEDPLFSYQFQIFFSPPAHRMRAARIGRVCAVLDAVSNLAQALVMDPGEWEKKPPVGINIDVEELTEDDRSIVTAYRSLDVPVEGTLPEGMPSLLSRDQARTVLFGSSKAKATSSEIPDEEYLSGDDDDALDYARIQPNHDEQGLNADGRIKTRYERAQDAEDAYTNEMAEAQEESVAMDIDPAPPYAPPEPAATESFGTSALQVSLGQMSEGAGAGTPQQALTPVSAVTSIQSSEGASAISSASASSAQPEGNKRHRKSTVAARRSDNWRGRSAIAGPRPRSPRRRSPSPRRPAPPRDRSPSRRYQHSPPRSHDSPRRYSPRQYSPRRRSPSPGRYERRRSPPRSSAMAVYTQGMLAGLPTGATVVQARQQQQLVHETDSGILASVSVLTFSASGNAITLPAPSGRQGHPAPFSPSVHAPTGRIENVQESSGSRYRRTSRSPSRDYYPSRRSSPPREYRPSASRYSPPRNTPRAPPRAHGSRRGRRQEPFQTPTPAWGAAEEIPAAWGELNALVYTTETSTPVTEATHTETRSPIAPLPPPSAAPVASPSVAPSPSNPAAAPVVAVPEAPSVPAPSAGSSSFNPPPGASLPASADSHNAESSAPGPSNPS